MNAAPPRKPHGQTPARRHTDSAEPDTLDPHQRDPDTGDLKAPTSVGKAPLAPGEPDPDPGTSGGLPLPHERDESVGGTSAGPPDPKIEQARRDIESGQVDTDLRHSAGLDEERRRAMVEGRDPPPPAGQR